MVEHQQWVADFSGTSRSAVQRTAGFNLDDYDLVVIGSLARGEWTSGSDVDCTLLIDGQASSDHRRVAREIESRLRQFNWWSAGESLAVIAILHCPCFRSGRKLPAFTPGF